MVNATTKTPATSTPKAAKNIFKAPLSGTRAVQARQLQLIRSKNRKKGYAYLGIATVLLAVYSVLFLYPQINLYLSMPSYITRTEKEIEEYDTVIIPNLYQEKDLHKAAYDDQFKRVEEDLDKVLPPTIDKLGVVRRLENFATAINAKTPPFEFNSISFAEPIQIGEYAVLPMSTSINSSTTNFERFLQLIHLSGRLDSDLKIRLMEISNINVSYRGVDPRTGEDKGVSFSVNLNAYSR